MFLCLNYPSILVNVLMSSRILLRGPLSFPPSSALSLLNICKHFHLFMSSSDRRILLVHVSGRPSPLFLVLPDSGPVSLLTVRHLIDLQLPDHRLRDFSFLRDDHAVAPVDEERLVLDGHDVRIVLREEKQRRWSRGGSSYQSTGSYGGSGEAELELVEMRETAATAYEPLEAFVDNQDDQEFVEEIMQALEKDPGLFASIVVMDHSGKFLAGESCSGLEEILGFVRKEEEMKSGEQEGKNAIWIDIQGDNKEELENIGKRLEIHPLTIEDCLLPNTRQKLEPFKNYMFIVFNSLHHVSCAWDIENPIKILVFAEFVITVHRYPSFAINTARTRLKRLHQGGFVKGMKAMDIVHAVADSIADTDVPVVNGIDNEINALEELVFRLGKVEAYDLLKRMSSSRRSIVRYRQLLWPKRDILLNIVQKDFVTILKTSINIAYFRDVYDHVVMMVQKLDVANELLTSLEATCLARASIEVADAANNANSVMKKFSSVATIILPMTFVTSLFGMNVKVPGQLEDEDSPLYPFFLLLGSMLISGVLLLYLFKRYRLL